MPHFVDDKVWGCRCFYNSSFISINNKILFFVIFLIAGVTCIIPEYMSGICEELKMKKYYYEDNVTLECKDGYTLDGSSQSQCQLDATWNPPLAKCVYRKYKIQGLEPLPSMVTH